MRKKSTPREFKERHHFKRQESSDSDHYLVMLVFGGVVLSRLVEELQVGVILGGIAANLYSSLGRTILFYKLICP